MKYHYQIVSSFDPTDIQDDSSNHNVKTAPGIEEAFEGYDSIEFALEIGKKQQKEWKLNPDQYYIKVIPVLEELTITGETDG